MSAYRFERSDGELAIEAWRPLDRALYRWTIGHGGDALLAATAAWTSFAEGQGDAALPLREGRHGMTPMTDAQIAPLRASPLVAAEAGQDLRPFVLDADARFYLQRNFAHEVAAAASIRERRAAVSTEGNADRVGFAVIPAKTGIQLDSGAMVPEARWIPASAGMTTYAASPEGSGRDASDADVDALFHGDCDAAVGPQREAVRRVAGRRLFVLTGGPGTGKTTTVLRMLLMLQRRAAAPLSIRIAAPTGKAAQRLVQALRQGKASLRNHPTAPLPADWQALLDTIPDTEALTLHRLLGYEPWRNAFRRNARDPIAADVVVVDEASMVDLAMLRCLLGAVRADATLILVGDADQLTSVATGSVLFDLVAALEADTRDDLVRLVHSFRAERHLVVVNEAVRAGDAQALDVALAASAGQAVLRNVADESALRERLARWAQELAGVEALRPALPVMAGDAESRDVPSEDSAANEAADRTTRVRRALAALSQRQLLCALRETAFGVVDINARLESLLRRVWGIGAQDEWYPGRAVIVTRNDYSAGLFNGDVGLCLADAEGHLRVWFETADGGDGQPDVRSFAPHTLPAHETAFAITIHKSQGSEYRHAAVLLPPDAEHRILSRQLLYTGVSRAKQSVEIWSTPVALQAALSMDVRRSGGLQGRIAAGGAT